MELKGFELNNQINKKINDNLIFSRQNIEDELEIINAKKLDYDLFNNTNLEFEKSKELENKSLKLEERRLNLLAELQKSKIEFRPSSSKDTHKKEEKLFLFLIALLLFAIILKYNFLIFL